MVGLFRVNVVIGILVAYQSNYIITLSAAGVHSVQIGIRRSVVAVRGVSRFALSHPPQFAMACYHEPDGRG